MEQSESIAKLALALSKAQAQTKAAKKESSNPFYKSHYADLAEVIETIKGPLADNEIAFTQFSDYEPSTGLIISTQITHSSGEWMRGYYPVIVKDNTDAQKLGAAVTYARRSALKAAVGLAEEDDDGNSLNNAPISTRKAPSSSVKPKSEAIPELQKKVSQAAPYVSKPLDQLKWPWKGNNEGKLITQFTTAEMLNAQKWLNAWDRETPQQQELLTAIETILGIGR